MNFTCLTLKLHNCHHTNKGHKPGGAETDIDEESKKLFGGSIPEKMGYLGDEYERKTIQILCFPLYSILLALENPTVHYLSLDVEGSEFPILKTIPFDKVDIKVIGRLNIYNTVWLKITRAPII